MSKKYPRELSERDLEISKWIAEQGAVRLSTLNQYLEIHYTKLDPRSLRNLANKLVLHGLASKERILAGPPIIWPTIDSLKLAGFRLSQGERVGKPSLANLLHSLDVSEIRLVYEKHGARWICERALQEEFKDHLPDGMAIINKERILVEVDRTRKESQRHLRIMNMNLSAGNYVVDYWTSNELTPFLLKQKKLLPLNLQERIRIFEIPKGGR